MRVLVLNCGSSSVKFQLIDTAGEAERCQARGMVERIGGQALVHLQVAGERRAPAVVPVRDHRGAIDRILRALVEDVGGGAAAAALGDIDAVGHRVVHGGEAFREPVVIDARVMEGIEDCIELAPLHNPANLRGIRAAGELLGTGVPQVAVFDTAFHATMPEASYLYAIPYQYYRRHRVRRYGFHGTSHHYLTLRYASLARLAPEASNIITLHLGNGCSACAVVQGRSFTTSMGFTPLEGLVMGTRSGDLDPSVVEFLMLKEGMDVHELDTMLNRHSGLLGLSGLTSDMRELLDEETEHQDRRVRLAIEVFCRRVRHYVGAYFAEMGGADAVVFSGGIGENAPEIRHRVCQGLECLGLTLDAGRNQALSAGGEGCISAPDATLAAWVIPTDEELLIARETARVLAA